MSLFVVHFGLRRQHPELAHHTVLFGPRYRELLNDIFRRGVLAEDFSLYVHAPSVTDPDLAPPGCSTYYALAPVPNLLKSTVDWQTEAPRYRDRILDYVERNYIPGPAAGPRDVAGVLAAGLRVGTQCPSRIRVLAGPGADAERVVPDP